MKADGYKRTYLISCIVVSVPCLFFIFLGIVNASLWHILFWGIILGLWWIPFVLLRRNAGRSFLISFLVANLFWWPLLIQTSRRIHHIAATGSLEGPGGMGSPVAFLLQMVIEQWFFIPASIVLIRGIIELKKLPRRVM
jgi:hypothetical protein